MKTIIQRALPLNQQYAVTDKKYIPLIESCGIGCDNCGKLIANIATVKNEAGQVFNIGFDCLETILINNSLLSTNDIESYEQVKRMIPKIIRFSKTIRERIDAHRHLNITGLLFEKPTHETKFYPFYWLQNNQLKSRDNDLVVLKDIDFTFMISTLKSIFPRLTITA